MSEAPSLLRQRELLRMEYEHEKAEYLRASELVSVERKVKRGECWFPLTVVRSYYNALDRLVVEVKRRDGVGQEHGFEYGKPVCFFTMDAMGGVDIFSFRATVSYAGEERMVVVVPDESCVSRLQSADRLGVQLHFDETTYRLMFGALDRTMQSKEGTVARLREIFHGKMQPAFGAGSAVKLSFPWLNASQEAAVNEAMRAKDVWIVHGPPGTGKTTTLVEMVCETLRREPQVLVCAQSNTATDWIAEQLLDRGIGVLRIGNPTRVNDKMLASTYEKRFESHPDYPALWQIRRNIRQLYSLPRKDRNSFHQKLNRLKDRADELEIRIRQSLFDTSRVIASTLAGAANPVLSGQHFHTLFIDEAAQALEAACWIPLQCADRVILAGDHCQLPPTIKSPEAMRGGLGVTLMEQVACHYPRCVSLLTTQYRMNETLMRFSSEWFYGGRLTAAPEIRHRSMIDDIDAPMVWVDTDLPENHISDTQDEDAGETMRETFVSATSSRVNRGEAQLTLEVLVRYCERIGRQRLLEERADIGIISPYKAQVKYLRSLLRRHEYLRPLCRHITIDTVDAFQGQERDIILISLVRANEDGQIGFLGDLRRMNVAITRARSKLIIIGSVSTLCRHKFYRRLHEYCLSAAETP